MMLYKRSILFFVMIGIIITTCTYCSKGDKAAPSIPPSESFIMDFSDFNSLEDTAKIKNSSDTSYYRNWLRAYKSIAFWNAIVTGVSRIPMAAYKEALNREAKFIEEDHWEWRFPFYVQSAHNGVLTAKRSGDNIHWEMKIDQFTWFTGLSPEGANSASWLLYEAKSNPVPLLQINWTEKSDGTYQMYYEYIKPESAEKGNYIKYGINSEDDYNAYYTISGSLRTIQIKWNRSSRKGRIKIESSLSDSTWKCWDEKLRNTTCP